MHSYLRSIGFSKIKSRHALEEYYRDTLSAPHRKVATTIAADTTLIQFDKNFGRDFGLSLIGEIDSSGSISIEHYFPFVRPHNYFEAEYVRIEKDPEKEAYRGIIDDFTMSIIFYVQNITDYAKLAWFNNVKPITSVMFSALAKSGMILLPVEKTYEEVKIEKSRHLHTSKLLDEAKKGNMDAISELAISEYDLKNSIIKRVNNSEDIFSIVNTSFIPYEVSSDHYDVIGIITRCEWIQNSSTRENVCIIDIDCNNFPITVAINEKDLLGEPQVGRRFKGSIWLQAYLNI